MAHFLFADDGIKFDGLSPERGPLGGAESAFIFMLEALAKRGHRISVRNNCGEAMMHKGVSWKPLYEKWPDDVDVYVANRGWKVLDKMPQVKKRVFFVHNPATYMVKWRYMRRLLKWRPKIVFSGNHHAATYPAWAPPWGQEYRVVIPYGITDLFRGYKPLEIPPKPKVVFTSNPLRGLDWLLQLWEKEIYPHVPAAELHLFCGVETYKAAGTELGAKIEKILDVARGLSNKGVVLRTPLPKPELVHELRSARALLYKGDVGESFSLALGEAQAMGVPIVVQDIGCVAERVRDGETGYVENNDHKFAARAVEILKNDDEWRRLHEAALKLQQNWGWDNAAAEFEKLAA
jgi:glycosyltransferase involved in cell wall biosynthesis